MTQLDRPQMAV